MELMHLGLPRPQRSDEEIFEGGVLKRVLVGEEQAELIRSIEVTFPPGARTKLHHHTVDQMLIITHGHGVVANTEKELRVRAGDIVLIPAGEHHWHGSDGETEMTHISVLTPGKEFIVE